MFSQSPYENWQVVFNSARSEFFSGRTSDTVFDRQQFPSLAPHGEANYTQSNARVLVGQAANGNFRFLAIPTQVYPGPQGEGDLGMGPGMYYRSDVVMYAGDLHFKISLDGSADELDMASPALDNRTWYAEHFLPLTRGSHPDLDIHIFSLAPVAANANLAALSPAPLPGPAGAIYALHVRNLRQEAIQGKVALEAGDMLVGQYEDSEPDAREMNRPDRSMRQRTLILSRPNGAVGIHFHRGTWIQTSPPYRSERAFTLQPGEEMLFETFIAAGASFHDIMPTIYEFYLHPSLDWLNRTAAYWRSRLGNLIVNSTDASEQVRVMQEIYIRSLFDNFNCLQTDAMGNLLVHWQGAPSHGFGICWGIDVEPTAGSLVHFCPQMTRQTMLFFITRSRAPRGAKDHSLPILVAPVILARHWLQVTGDTDFLEKHPEVLPVLQDIMDEVVSLKAPSEDLFPSRYSSDGAVGRRYDFGANVKTLYAFDSLAYILQKMGRGAEAGYYQAFVERIRSAIYRTMIVEGPFGPQISGGTNLGEDPARFYLPEEVLYYDGEDTSSMLAPLYGACDFDWLPWVNYHRFARSLWCPTYDPEFGMLNWFPSEPAVQDGTSFFSRLGGSVTPEEMKEAVEIMRVTGIDDATGSSFWWPHGLEYKRSLTRCSQGQGAWAWQYFQQWLGITMDYFTRTITLAPRGLISSFNWTGFRSGESHFDLFWEENTQESIARVVNHSPDVWTVRVGFRAQASGASSILSWKMAELASEAEIIIKDQPPRPQQVTDMTDGNIRRVEAQEFSPDKTLMFKRYGPAMLWGHWDASKHWQYSELPNALRFIVFNNSPEDWTKTTVDLVVPAGWTAQARQPRHWSSPDHLQPDAVAINLGYLASGCHTVAPFWIREPHGKGLLSPISTGDFGSGMVSSHTTSQPGKGIQLASYDIKQRQVYHFIAHLQAVTTDGQIVEASLDVPIIIECINKGAH